MSILQLRRILRKATQAEQEAGTSGTVVVTPANQQNHPSAAKWWGYATVSAGTPTLQVSYNVTSITDVGTGLLTWTIATDFSSVNWAPMLTILGPAAAAMTGSVAGTQTAGAIQQYCIRHDNVALDPEAWAGGGFGDQ